MYKKARQTSSDRINLFLWVIGNANQEVIAIAGLLTTGEEGKVDAVMIRMATVLVT